MQTRDRIVRSAARLFLTRSYQSVGVGDLCAVADVRKGRFYHFFPSKTDLVVAALEAHYQSVKPELDLVFDPAVPPADRLRNLHLAHSRSHRP